MARARNIKPNIMANETLGELPPLTRLLFIYLWMLADREGRIEDRPRRIAALALPFDTGADVESMLSELAAAGFIGRYQADGLSCIQVLNFYKHQSPHVREQASGLPPMPSDEQKSTAKAVPRHCQGGAMSSPRSPDSLIPDSLNDESGFGTCDPPAESPRPVSKSTAICFAMRAAGLPTVNPSHPDLAALIERGAEIGMFEQAARQAVEKGKSFAYAIGIVKGQLQDAQNLAKGQHNPAGSYRPTKFDPVAFVNQGHKDQADVINVAAQRLA